MNTLFHSISIVCLLFLVVGCAQAPRCDQLRDAFDDAVQRSTLPIIEDNRSLCHGLNMGSDFSKLEPVWAVGTLTAYDERTNTWTFTGKNESMPLTLPRASIEPEIGADYRIDMTNICKQFFMMVDSRYPSPLAASMQEPTPVTCK